SAATDQEHTRHESRMRRFSVQRALRGLPRLNKPPSFASLMAMSKQSKTMILGLALATAALQGCQTTTDSCCSDGAWTTLFDGKSTDAFRGYNSDKFPEGWVVEGKVLHVLPGKHGGDLMTKEEFEDFELSYEWKV